MLRSTARQIMELVRCMRHNLLHLRVFRVTFRRGLWHVHDGRGVEMVFPHYPYLAFHDIEGYLRHGDWRIEPGMTVVDAGGCWGEFALYAAKCVGPGGRVLMLEPDPGNVEVAKKTFELNGNPAQLEVIPAGLWREPGKLRFGAGQGATSTLVDVAFGANGSGDSIEIDVESLASLARRAKLGRLDFVKMDIEGAELEAVAGATDLPSACKPRYAIASYHVVNGTRTADVLPGLFSKMGYDCTTGNDRHLTTWAWPAGTTP